MQTGLRFIHVLIFVKLCHWNSFEISLDFFLSPPSCYIFHCKTLAMEGGRMSKVARFERFLIGSKVISRDDLRHTILACHKFDHFTSSIQFSILIFFLAPFMTCLPTITTSTRCCKKKQKKEVWFGLVYWWGKLPSHTNIIQIWLGKGKPIELIIEKKWFWK